MANTTAQHESVTAIFDAAQDYLSAVRELSASVDVAMSALATNNLIEFQRQVAVQELLAGSVVRLSQKLPKGHPVTPHASVSDSSLSEEIDRAHFDLARANKRYALLLQRSNRSLELMLSLCRAYASGIPDVKLPAHPQPTLSFEV